MRLFTFIFIIFYLLSGCNFNVKEKKKTVIENIYSDTLFPFTLKLLENVKPYSSFPITYHFYYDGADTFLREPILNVFRDSLANYYTDSILIDSLFGKEIFETYKKLPHTIHTKNYKELRFMSKDTLEKMYNLKSYGKPNNAPLTCYSFSLPVLSPDKKFLLIELDELCWSLCGQGNTYIFHENNGIWTLYKVINRWIS